MKKTQCLEKIKTYERFHFSKFSAIFIAADQEIRVDQLASFWSEEKNKSLNII